jgi:hypothetical protein
MPVFDLDVIVAIAEREEISLYEAEQKLAALLSREDAEESE